ncbi:MAG: Asp-tRNA(Asn)/Glu-tRNA(Gln) amidotransferase subunit GatC [Bacillota bacterium]
MVTKEEISELAFAARLKLNEEEASNFALRLSDLLNLMEEDLAKDLSEVKPFAFVHNISNAFREDEIKKSLDQEAVLANAPLAQDGQFLVPRII